MLISRVKNFNLRFKALAYAGDPTVLPPDGAKLSGGLETFYPKDTPAFRELDELVSSFKASFPARMKQPVVEGKLDHYLYCSLNMANLFVTLASIAIITDRSLGLKFFYMSRLRGRVVMRASLHTRS